MSWWITVDFVLSNDVSDKNGGNIMEWLTIIPMVLIFYVVIQVAIDRSVNTTLLKENHKVLVEIRELLKQQNKNL